MKTIIIARRFDEGRQLYKYLKDLGRGSETFYIQEANLSMFPQSKRAEEIERIKKLVHCFETKGKNYEVLELTQEEVNKIIDSQKVLFQWHKD